MKYNKLDELRNIKINNLLSKRDNDEIYQIWKNEYIGDNNIASFYCWIIENYCYLIDLLNYKFELHLYDNEKDNPIIKKRHIYILTKIGNLTNYLN